MYIKVYEKINYREDGYVLLEAIVILMAVACICIMLNKIVINNYLKSDVVYTRDDVKTLSKVEEEVLLRAMIYFNEDETRKTYSVDNPGENIKKITISISEDSGLLIKEKGTNGKSYIKLKCEKSEVNGKVSIKLIPSFYKTDYIVG